MLRPGGRLIVLDFYQVPGGALGMFFHLGHADRNGEPFMPALLGLDLAAEARAAGCTSLSSSGYPAGQPGDELPGALAAAVDLDRGGPGRRRGMSHDLVIHGGLTVSGNGVRRADVAITNGVIAEVAPEIGPGAARVLDASGVMSCPASSTPTTIRITPTTSRRSRSAAAGGVTTLVPSPDAGYRTTIPDRLSSIPSPTSWRPSKNPHTNFGAHAIVSPHDDPAVFVPGLIAAPGVLVQGIHRIPRRPDAQ